MPLRITCPSCARPSTVSEALLGKKGRCPGCGTVFRLGGDAGAAEAPRAAQGTAATPTPKPTPVDDPYSIPRAPRLGREEGPFTFHLKVKHDPNGELKGVYRVELSRGGLRLYRKTSEAARIPVKTPARSVGKGLLAVTVAGRDLTFAPTQLNLYNERLAADLVAFLNGRVRDLDQSAYVIPKPLIICALLPLGVGFVLMLTGGALGGGIGGAIAGCLITANLSFVRREHWPKAARLGACLATSAVGYGLLVLIVVALVKASPGGAASAGGPPPPVASRPVEAPRQDAPAPLAVRNAPHFAPEPTPASHFAPGPIPAPHFEHGLTPAPLASRPVAYETAWGTAEDPDGDCRITVDGATATIEVPGTVHELSVRGGRCNSPRVLRPAAGDFVAEVRVDGEQVPSDPPAPGALLPFKGAGLVVWAGAGHFVRLERAAFRRGDQVQTYVLFELHRVGGPSLEQNAPTEPGPLHLRVERRGERLSAAFSRDGQSWRPFGPFPFTGEAVSVGVEAVNTTAAPFRPRFDGFRYGRL